MAKYRVLIVDDQREIRLILRAGLQTLLGADIQITDVPSGEEAILVISRQPIELLITDVRLPGISGLELRERALVRNPGLKVILMTGMPEPRTRREVERAGADAYFFKPFELPDFLEAVKNCLGLATAPAAAEESKADLPPQSLDERLSSLHDELGAVAVILLDEDGQVVAETRQMADYESDSPMLTAVTALFGAAMKVGHLLGTNSRDWMFFKGKEHDLALTHISSAFCLLALLPTGALEGQQLGKLPALLGAAGAELAVILAQMGVTAGGEQPAAQAAPAPEPEEEVDISAVLPELDAIFGKAEKSKKPKDVDAFWDELSSAGGEEVRRADALSYDQARQLGLAPEE